MERRFSLTVMALVGLLFALLYITHLKTSPTLTGQACLTAETLTTTPHDDLDPQWSPDGRQIAFVGHHEGNPEVYLLDVATRALTNLSNSTADDFRPMWSPNNQYVVYVRRDKPGLERRLQLILVEVATGDSLMLAPPDQDAFAWGIQWLQWSADSKSMMFGGSNANFNYDVVAGELRELSHDRSNISYSFWPAFDNSHAIITVTDWTDNSAHRFFTIDLLDSSQTKEPFLSDYIWAGNWSPDSTHFAFYTNNYPGPKPSQFYIYDSDTSILHVIDSVEGAGFGSGVWSPDGRFAWATSSPTQDGLPIRMSLIDQSYSSASQLLELNTHFTMVGWSPTRDQIAFYSYAGVYVLDVPTGNFHDFIQGLGMVKKVTWSPDGSYVAASIFKQWGVVNQIALADIRDGSLCVYGNTFIFSDPQWSPTGNRLVFSSGEITNSNLILLTLPD
jgi:Tol biopolymer transport system component